MSPPGRNGSGPAANDEATSTRQPAEQADSPSLGEVDARRQLEILGHGAGDYTSISWRDNTGWNSEVVPTAVIPAMVKAHAGGGDVYLGVNPVRPVGRGRRGGNADVTRLAALVAELDYDKLPPAGAWAVIVTLAGMVGWPSLIVHSGHGMHVYWPVDPDGARGLSNAAAAVLAARFGMLAAVVARSHGGRVDVVSDLARVLRAAGTVNFKRRPAVLVRGYEIARGKTVFPDEVTEILDAYGVPEITEQEATAVVVAPPSVWPWTPERVTAPCRYVDVVRGGWINDPPRGSRHNWLLDQAVRLHEFHRRGCLGSREQYEQYRAELRTAFFRRLAGAGGTTPRGEEPPNEFEVVMAWSIRRTATKTDRQVIEDSGRLHAHDKRAAAAAEHAALLKGSVLQ